MEYDFSNFWKKSIADARRISVDPETEKNRKKSSFRFTVLNMRFRGFLKTPVTGELVLPSGIRKPRVCVHIHDYNRPLEYSTDMLPRDVAHYFMYLRGHENIVSRDAEAGSPGLLAESLIDRDNYWGRAVYLDLIRAIDALRLMDEVDCSAVGLYGKNFGAAAAMFAAAFSDRVKAMVLDTPSFTYLNKTQNIATSEGAEEINLYVASMSRKKSLIKKNLSYFDALNFSPRINCEVLVTVGLNDTLSPPQGIFSLFNHLRCPKTMEVYPEEGNSAGGKVQLKKSYQWLAEKILTFKS